MNVFFMVCVQNLICQWRTEKQVSNYVSSLNAFQGYPGLATVSGLNTLAADPSYFLDAGHSSMMNLTSPSYKCNTIGRFDHVSSSALLNAFGLPRTASIKHNPLNYAHSYGANPLSEFDARNFQQFMYRKNAFMDNFTDGPSATNDIQKPRQYSTQSLDRRRFLQQQPHQPRPHWPSFSDAREQVTLRPLTTRPFDYLQRPGSMSNLNLIGKPDISNFSPSSLTRHNNNNDVHKVNLNLTPISVAMPSKAPSISGLDTIANSAQPTGNLHQSDQNSSLHSIRDIAL
jgi:hypothetical protein